ncbi:MAG TPA: TerD family protein [Burkholderiaceae bacterium]|nr:TerD family protein [Burkholderiaceae bacterium]
MHDWDVAENWIELQGHITGPDQLTLPMPSALARHFDENSNYLIKLDPLGDGPVQQGVRWSMSSGARAPVNKPPVVIASAVVERDPGMLEARADMAWRTAQELDSREAYAAFLAAHPSSRNADEARSALARLAPTARSVDSEELAWRAACEADSKASWTAFMITHSDGAYAERAKAKLAAFMPPCLVVQTRWSVIGAAAPYGVDTCAFLLTPAGQVRGDADFISNWATDPDTNAILRHSPCGSVRNSGINKDRGRHVSESLEIDLDQVPPEIDKIAVTVSMNVHAARHHCLPAVDSTTELIDTARGEVLVAWQSGHGAVGSRGRVMLMLQRHGTDWKLHRSSETFEDGIYGLCKRFGIVVA